MVLYSHKSNQGTSSLYIAWVLFACLSSLIILHTLIPLRCISIKEALLTISLRVGCLNALASSPIFPSSDWINVKLISTRQEGVREIIIEKQWLSPALPIRTTVRHDLGRQHGVGGPVGIDKVEERRESLQEKGVGHIARQLCSKEIGIAL